MAITINGSGTVTGLSVGGLPDGTVDSGTLATDSVTAVKIPDTVESSLKSGRKNLIINGGFDVWQRGTSFSSPASNTYLADRWSAVVQSATVSKESITDLPGFSSALKLTTGATDPYFVQKVEGTYFRGQTMTFSFWVKGDIPPHTMFYDYTNTFSAQTPILIDTVGAWKRYSNTYVLPTTAPTQDYLTLRIDLAESSSSIQYLTGVQAELGSVATDFEHRSYGEELALCQRYYEKNGSTHWATLGGDANGIYVHNPVFNYAVTKRVTPTLGLNVTAGASYQRISTDKHGFDMRNNSTNSSGGADKYISWTADAEL